MHLENYVDEKEYKQILISIMDAIDGFCRSKSMNYFMIGGTLLGAVRHKGFIPWDDDIDIGIERKDYIQFCNEFNNNRNDTLRLVCLQNCDNYYLPSAKVIDTSTSLIENCYQAIEIGVYIDVFPLDYLSFDNLKEAESLLTRKRLSDKLTALKSMNVSKTRAIWKNGLILLGRFLRWGSMHSLSNDFEKRILRISSTNKEEYIANVCGAWGKREITNSSYFSETIELDFEGRRYLAPIGYVDYLKCIYGDYMQLPPVEKRITHHDFVVKRRTV